MKYVYLRDFACYAEEDSEELAFFVGRSKAIGGTVYPWKDGEPHPRDVLIAQMNGGQTLNQDQPVADGVQTL